MATYPKVGVGYNAQVAVDAKHKLIVEQEVTNLGSDLGQLAPTAILAKEALGVDSITATADRGYFAGEDIPACEAAGITAFKPKPLGRGAAASNGRFPKEAFLYNAAANTYRCPHGETLSRHGEFTTRVTGCCSTTIRRPAGVVQSGRNAPPTRAGGASRAGKARPCSMPWPCGWRPTHR